VSRIDAVTFSGQIGNYIQLVNNSANLDASNATYDGTAVANGTAAAYVAIEDKMVHKQDTAGLGLVRVKPGALFATASGSIQRSIVNATAGDTIYVGPGTYAELLTVNKSVSLIGPNAGLDGTDATRGAEALVVPPAGTVPTDVVIDGMTISGSNSASNASPYTANGANLQADVAIYSTANGTIIRNSVVENAFQFGMLLGGDVSTPMYGQIRDNLVTNAAWFSGIAVRNNYYALIDGNTVEDSWRGIQTNNHSLPAPAGSDARISNTVDHQWQHGQQSRCRG
jgi:hypothetical protein